MLECKNGVCFLTDPGSRSGTRVNGQEIRGQGERRLDPSDTVKLGQTTLRIEILTGPAEVVPPTTARDPLAPKILHMVDTKRAGVLPVSATASVTERRLGLLLELPRQFSAHSGRNELLQTIMDRVVEVLPQRGGERCSCGTRSRTRCCCAATFRRTNRP